MGPQPTLRFSEVQVLMQNSPNLLSNISFLSMSPFLNYFWLYFQVLSCSVLQAQGLGPWKILSCRLFIAQQQCHSGCLFTRPADAVIRVGALHFQYFNSPQSLSVKTQLFFPTLRFCTPTWPKAGDKTEFLLISIIWPLASAKFWFPQIIQCVRAATCTQAHRPGMRHREQFFKEKASLRDTEIFTSSHIDSYSSSQFFKPHACPPAQLWLPLCDTFIFKVWLSSGLNSSTF